MTITVLNCDQYLYHDPEPVEWMGILVGRASKEEKYAWFKRSSKNPSHFVKLFQQQLWKVVKGEEVVLVLEALITLTQRND